MLVLAACDSGGTPNAFPVYPTSAGQTGLYAPVAVPRGQVHQIDGSQVFDRRGGFCDLQRHDDREGYIDRAIAAGASYMTMAEFMGYYGATSAFVAMDPHGPHNYLAKVAFAGTAFNVCPLNPAEYIYVLFGQDGMPIPIVANGCGNWMPDVFLTGIQVTAPAPFIRMIDRGGNPARPPVSGVRPEIHGGTPANPMHPSGGRPEIHGGTPA